MFCIIKEFSFSASHQLSHLPIDHPCARLHGHNYKVALELRAEKCNNFNFVRDFRDLDFFKNYLDQEIDHRHLNDVFNSNAVTSEFLAQHFYNWCKENLPELYSVKVSETPKTWACYCPFL